MPNKRSNRNRNGNGRGRRSAPRAPPSISAVERQAALLVNKGTRYSTSTRSSTFTRVVKFASISSGTYTGPSAVQTWDLEDIFGPSDTARLAELYDEYCIQDTVIHLVCATARGENPPDLLSPNSVSRVLSSINRDYSYPLTEVEFLNMRGLKGSMTRKCTDGAVFFHHIKSPVKMDRPQSDTPSPGLQLKRWLPTATPNIPHLGWSCCMQEPQARLVVGNTVALTFTVQCKVMFRGSQ